MDGWESRWRLRAAASDFSTVDLLNRTKRDWRSL
jgi:hypothetical protein